MLHILEGKSPNYVQSPFTLKHVSDGLLSLQASSKNSVVLSLDRVNGGKVTTTLKHSHKLFHDASYVFEVGHR